MLAFLFWDPTLLLLIPAMLFAFWAQMRVRSAYNAGLKVAARRGLSGRDVAERLLSSQGLRGVSVRATHGQLDDHYDPRNQTVNLSPAVYEGASLASLAIAAHETGHALQHAQRWAPLSLRSAMAPTVGFASTLAFPLFFIGFLFSSVRPLMDLGILFFAGAVLFHMVTLPVEFDASRRAMALLKDGRYLEVDEAAGAKQVLDAAALTYVAAAAMSALQLVRLLILRNSRD